MKSFNEWLEEIVNKEMAAKEKKDSMESKGFLGHNYHDRLLQLYTAYQNYQLVEKTKWLVFATWALVIATILLVVFKA